MFFYKLFAINDKNFYLNFVIQPEVFDLFFTFKCQKKTEFYTKNKTPKIIQFSGSIYRILFSKVRIIIIVAEENTEQKGIKSLWIEKLSWIVRIIAGSIALYEFVIKHLLK